jgi:hypothetical protein
VKAREAPVYTEYSNIVKHASPCHDVFGLGMVFLCMLQWELRTVTRKIGRDYYTCSTVDLFLWVRDEMSVCKRHGDEPCTPAHVLLAIDGLHDSCESSMTLELLRKTVLDRSMFLSSLPLTVKILLVQMTAEKPISISDCERVLLDFVSCFTV